MTIIIRRPWTRQPQHAVGARTDGISGGLIVAVNGAAGGGNRVASGIAVSQTAALDRAPTQGGVGIGGFSASSYLSFTNPLGTNDPATVFALLKNTATTDQGFWTLTDNPSTDGQDHMPYGGVIYSSTLATSRWINGASVPGGTSALLSPFSFCVTRSWGSSGFFYPTFNAYLNGTNIASSSSIGGPAAGTVFRLGANSQSSMFYVGRILLFAMWNRELKQTELLSLRSNPWQIFKPQSIKMPTAASGYTHPTLSNARVGSLTSTSGVPLVDYAF